MTLCLPGSLRFLNTLSIEASKPNNVKPTESQVLKDFEQLTRQHIQSLWRSAYRMTGSHASADDLTQETCLKAFRSIEQYEQGTNYRAWLFKILVNLCRDYQRREARAPFKYWDTQEVESVLAKSHDKGNQPDMQLQQTVFYTHALEAMSRLSPDIRIVVSLSLLDGMSYQEIAEMVDIPIGTVRSRLSRGRKKLQDDLKIHAIEDSGECAEVLPRSLRLVAGKQTQKI